MVSSVTPKITERDAFNTAILGWYEAVHRKLPWRDTQDPYKIWISEVMLQQTQVSTVIDYFNRFIGAFPTVEALAQADEDAVFKLWEGLGYYSRARNLMKCARVLTLDHGGQFPRTLKEALKLPGIGPYTAGAVLSIAYNLPYPAVDGNVMRVLSRLLSIGEDIGEPKTRLVFEDIVYDLLPEDRRHFNQALMELGATVCTPKQFQCPLCPVNQYCQAFRDGTVGAFPVKRKKIQKTVHEMALAFITVGDTILLVKRNEPGLLSGLWGFPLFELPEGVLASMVDPLSLKAFQEELETALGISLRYDAALASAKHVFTHRVWHMTLLHFVADTLPVLEYPETAVATLDTLEQYALPTAYHKLLKDMKQRNGEGYV